MQLGKEQPVSDAALCGRGSRLWGQELGRLHHIPHEDVPLEGWTCSDLVTQRTKAQRGNTPPRSRNPRQDLVEKMLGNQRKSGHIQPVSPTNPARAPLTGALGTPSRAPLKHEEVQGPAASAALTTPTERSCQAPSREVGGGMSDHVSVPVPRAVPDPSDIQRCDGDLLSLGEAPAR